MPFDPDVFLAATKKPPSTFDPDAFLAAKKTAHSWGEMPGYAVDEIGGAISDAGKFIASLPDDPLGYKIGRAIKAAPGAIAHEAGGSLQYFRDKSPKEFRGSAPTFEGGEPEKHPWLEFTAGDATPLKEFAITRPLALLGDVASVAGLTAPGRAALGMLSDAAIAGPRKGLRAIADLTPANRAENALHLAASQTSSPNTIAALLENNKPPVPGVGYSAAQATQDPGMAQLEKSSRINQGPAWAQFDTGQNTGLFNAMQGVVAPADDAALSATRDARDAATKYDRRAALALADQGSLEPFSGTPEQYSDPIKAKMIAELAGDRGALPAVKKVGAYVLNPETMATAGRTYEARKLISDALNRRAGADLGETEAAVKSADVTSRAIKGSIDASLNKASGGIWQDYLDSFKVNSKDVNSVQALNNIRADLEKKIEGGAVDGNGNPKLTRAYLKQVIERHSTNKYGDTILPGPQGELDKILSTAQQLEAPQANYRMAATGGGGSDTVSNLALSHLVRKAGPMGRIASAVISGLGEGGGATRLAGLLQNPADAANAIRTAAGREAARKVKSTGVKPAALAAILAAQPQQ